LKKQYLLYLFLFLVVSCSGVPKNNEQVAGSREQGRGEGTALSGVSEISDSAGAQEETAVSQIMREGAYHEVVRSLSGGRMNSEPEDSASELAEIDQPEAIPEEPVLAEAEEEDPQAEYVGAFSVLDEPQEIAGETEAQPTDQPVIAMETLRPVEAPPSEPAFPSEPAPPVKPAAPAEPAKPATPALPERRTAQIVPPDFSPPVRESWERLPKEEPPAIVQEPPPVAEDPPEERIILPDYPITFSRTARVTVGQLVEIPFRGKDWVFIGEVGARRGIAYDSRKTDPEGDSFIFRVDAAGTYALKFYRQDFMNDLILNDHVQIIAGGNSETAGLGWFNPP